MKLSRFFVALLCWAKRQNGENMEELINNIKNGSILKPMISDKVLEAIINDNPEYLTVFFYQAEEIKNLQNKMKHV